MAWAIAFSRDDRIFFRPGDHPGIEIGGDHRDEQINHGQGVCLPVDRDKGGRVNDGVYLGAEDVDACR